MNQNKKRIKTKALSPNSITSPIIMSTTTTPSEPENTHPNILSEETTPTTANTTEPSQPINPPNEPPTEPNQQNPTMETITTTTITHPKDNQINSDPMEVDPQNQPQNNNNTKSPLNPGTMTIIIIINGYKNFK